MFCPRCGTNSSIDLKFCRSCGFQLDQVAPLLEEKAAEATLSHAADQALASQQKLKRIGSIAVISTVSFALLAILVVLVWSMATGVIPVLLGSFALLVLVGMFTGFLFLGLASVKENHANEASPAVTHTGSLAGSDPTTKHLLNPGIAPLPSVTEGTTELLIADKRDR